MQVYMSYKYTSHLIVGLKPNLILILVRLGNAKPSMQNFGNHCSELLPSLPPWAAAISTRCASVLHLRANNGASHVQVSNQI